MKPLFFSILFALLLPAGFAHSQQQHVFVAGSHNTINLFSLDLSNCTRHYIDTLPIGMYTIACTPNGKLWALMNDTVGAWLYQVDTSTGSLTYAGHFDTHDDFVQTMGVLNDSVLLIMCNNDLYGVTTTNVRSFKIGTVGNYRFGDMTWMGQDLYIIGFDGLNPDSSYLVKVTFNNGSYPPIASAAPVSNTPSLPYSYGLATYIIPNANTTLIGFADSNAYIINPTNGTYTLYCSILPDSLYTSDAASISYPTVPIILDTVNPTSIVNPINSELIVKLYPNPASKELNVTYDGNNKAILTLIDITGRPMLSRQLIKGTQQINIAQLAVGYYMAIIQTKDKVVYRQKIIKQ